MASGAVNLTGCHLIELVNRTTRGLCIGSSFLPESRPSFISNFSTPSADRQKSNPSQGFFSPLMQQVLALVLLASITCLAVTMGVWRASPALIRGNANPVGYVRSGRNFGHGAGGTVVVVVSTVGIVSSGTPTTDLPFNCPTSLN